jgi:hypothetical protein
MYTLGFSRPLLVAAAGMLVAAQTTQAASIGIGTGIAAYHNQATGWVMPVTYAPGTERYEFGLTWLSRQYQTPPGGSGAQDLKVNLAPGQFVATFSRRWVLLREHRVQPLLAFGFAYLSARPCDGEPELPGPAPRGSVPVACNYLLGTHLNFTEQGGVRIALNESRDWHLEITARHMSNGGLAKLNRGQNVLQAILRWQLR